MDASSQSDTQFLTVEESHQVDAALLSSREKFSARVAIYALRVLKQIATEQGCSVPEVTNQQVVEWVEKDEAIKQQAEIGSGFEGFFTKLVISALQPLQKSSQEAGVSIQDLTTKQVLAWFEKDAKLRREQEN